jgi:hypothetical protein
MLDNINLELSIPVPRRVMQRTDVKFDWKDILFVPDYKKGGGYYGYVGTWKNLQLKIFQNKLTIKNSWHKFHLGNNYSNYSIKDIENTLFTLADKLGERIWEAEIKKIAYGCVIEEDPYLNFPNWRYLHGKESTPMFSKGGYKYGAFFDSTDYRLKGYDKTHEVLKHDKLRIPDNLFRLECEVKSMRHLTSRKNAIFLSTPRDLCDIEKMQYLTEDLVAKYHDIKKYRSILLSGATSHELNVIASIENHAINKELKKHHNKTYKRYNKIYNDLEKLGNEYYDIVERKIISKCGELINS